MPPAVPSQDITQPHLRSKNASGYNTNAFNIFHESNKACYMAQTGRYSHFARRALMAARELAKRHHHIEVDTDHLLAGILRNEGSVGYSILRELHLSPDHVESIIATLHPVADEPPNPLEMTTALRDALDLAVDEARWLGHHYIGTEHLLLGIARGGQGKAPDVLRLCEVSPDGIRRRVRRLIQSGVLEIDIESAKRMARMSELSRRVLNSAEQLAEQYGHREVSLTHLLLALAREHRSACSRVLRECGLDEDAIEAQLSGQYAASSGGSLEGVLDLAVDKADSLGTHYTGTDHILLAVCTHPRGIRLLQRYGVDPAAVEKAVKELLQSA